MGSAVLPATGMKPSPPSCRSWDCIPAKINLIPFNPWPGSNYECSDWEQIEKFADFINANGYASPIRKTRGDDILAACGQLKSESERLKKSDRLALEAMMIAGHGE